jgi:hypothetical protein
MVARGPLAILVKDSLVTDENVRQHGLSYRAQYNTLERHGFGGESLFAPAEAVDGSVHALQQQSAQMVWKGGETIHLHRARLHSLLRCKTVVPYRRPEAASLRRTACQPSCGLDS